MHKFFGLALVLMIQLLSAGTAQAAEENGGEVLTVVRQVEKKVVSLPECNDAELIAKTKEFIAAYFDKRKDVNAAFRRRRHFITKGVGTFVKENIADYKTDKKRPISDLIVDLKVNQGVAEENIRLCRSQSPNREVSGLYLLLYPQKGGYKVYIPNLTPSETLKDIVSFSYE